MAHAFQDSISFLLAQIGKAHRSCADEHLNEVGLHVGQEMFLMCVWEHEGMTQTQIAERMGVQPPTVNKMLSRMEAVGLVSRRPDDDDNRVTRVHLTDKSRALQGEVSRVWDELEARTTANLSLDERVLLRRLLMQVYANLIDKP
ncbi:MAG: MarR family transcriptional regulator [Chloroflexota bacterium]|nr:MarR family transcriptional regulator [Chloroflexota bacterium]